MGGSDVILIIVIILIVWIYHWCFNHPNLETVSLSELLTKGKFKTGDLVLFKAVDNFNSPIIMSYYGHIGVVYVDPETKIPLIFEAANPTEMNLDECQNANGIFISPLEDRVKLYKGYTFYKELERPLDSDVCTEFKTFIDYCAANMKYETGVVSNGIKKCMGEPIGLRINCGEIVFLSLIKLGLIPLDYYKKKSWHHLRWMCGIKDLSGGNWYREPVKITYSPITS